jgi:excisionase family DNA binding protein
VRETASVPKRLLTTREVAERLSVSIFTVRNLADFGALPVVRFTPTSRMRFRSEDVEEFLSSRTRHEEATR